MLRFSQTNRRRHPRPRQGRFPLAAYPCLVPLVPAGRGNRRASVWRLIGLDQLPSVHLRMRSRNSPSKSVNCTSRLKWNWRSGESCSTSTWSAMSHSLTYSWPSLRAAHAAQLQRDSDIKARCAQAASELRAETVSRVRSRPFAGR